MSQKDILTLPNPVLRQSSAVVHKVDDRVHKLIKKMLDTCFDWEKHHPHELCVGLAAVQISELATIFLVRNDDQSKNFAVLINPRAIKKSGKIEVDYEGCLSVAGIYGLVPRYSNISLKALDADGREHYIEAKGFMARLIQHELDHLKGKLFVDKIKDQTKSFYKLNDKGELESLDYAKVTASGTFR